MNATENTFQGIALLEDNELLIGQLYRQFASIFPKQVRLWSELSLDEMIHARMLRGLRSRLPATNGGLNGVPSGSLSVVGTNGSEGRSFVPSPCEEFNHLGFFPLDS